MDPTDADAHTFVMKQILNNIPSTATYLNLPSSTNDNIANTDYLKVTKTYREPGSYARPHSKICKEPGCLNYGIGRAGKCVSHGRGDAALNPTASK
jgi:hypothetical protein